MKIVINIHYKGKRCFSYSIYLSRKVNIISKIFVDIEIKSEIISSEWYYMKKKLLRQGINSSCLLMSNTLVLYH